MAKDYKFCRELDTWRGRLKDVRSGKCLSKAVEAMTTLNITLPDALKSFIDDQVRQRGYSIRSEYVRELIQPCRS